MEIHSLCKQLCNLFSVVELPESRRVLNFIPITGINIFYTDYINTTKQLRRITSYSCMKYLGGDKEVMRRRLGYTRSRCREYRVSSR